MIIVSESSSGGIMSACLRVRGFENKMWECYAVKKMFAKNLLEQAATALNLGKSWTEESPYKEELALLRESDSAPGRHKCSKIDEGWKRGRLVGAVEE